ncbi:MAG: peptidylprolyl isomerase [Planctomycetes bacterium]|nr:peptidylprolyl isomerase [Planctomycetota bacterium]
MKANLVLAVLLLLLATIYFATETEFKISEETSEAFNPLIPGFDESLVTRIQITLGNQSINIKKNPGFTASGLPGKWLIMNAQYHPARPDVVEQMLSHLADLKKGFESSNEAEVYKDFGVDEYNALKVELFKTVSEIDEKTKTIDEKEQPYFSLLIGNSSETQNIGGVFERFIRVGKFDDSTKLTDNVDQNNEIPKFKYNKDIRRVKKVNLEIISADINKWIKLEVFKLNDVFTNVDDFQCINIINNDDYNKSIYLAKIETEEPAVNGTVRKSKQWQFYKNHVNAVKLDYMKSNEKADNNSVRNFLYEIKAFRAKSYLNLSPFQKTESGDIKYSQELDGRVLIKGELHKFITPRVKKDLKTLEQAINSYEGLLLNTPLNQSDKRKEYEFYLKQYRYKKSILEDSRILKFYIYEENMTIENAEDLKKTIEESGKPVADIATQAKISPTLLQQMINGQSKIQPDVIEKIRSEFPYMFHSYWMVLSSSRFENQGYLLYWQYTISHDQIQKLSPERKILEIPKPAEDNQTQPSDDENSDTETTPDDEIVPEDENKTVEPKDKIEPKIVKAPELPRVKIITNFGDIIVELYEDDAPNTVANFISLCEKGFYDNIFFHRIFKDYAIHVGCPFAKDKITYRAGTGDAGYKFRDEIKDNKRLFDKPGLLAMDNVQKPNSSGSKFLITIDAKPDWNKRFTIFGEVIEGMDIVKKINALPTIQNPSLGLLHSPVDDVFIKNVEILQLREHEYKVVKIEDE